MKTSLIQKNDSRMEAENRELSNITESVQSQNEQFQSSTTSKFTLKKLN